MARVLRFKVREIAEAKGITIERIARDANLGRNTVSLIWHNKTKDPGILTLEAIAKVLGVDSNDLREWVNDGTPDSVEESQ